MRSTISLQAYRSSDTRRGKLITAHGNPGDSLSSSSSINGISHGLTLSISPPPACDPRFLREVNEVVRETSRVLTFLPFRYIRTRLPSFHSHAYLNWPLLRICRELQRVHPYPVVFVGDLVSFYFLPFSTLFRASVSSIYFGLRLSDWL